MIGDKNSLRSMKHVNAECGYPTSDVRIKTLTQGTFNSLHECEKGPKQ
jgi:hypothetical protein